MLTFYEKDSNKNVDIKFSAHDAKCNVTVCISLAMECRHNLLS
jgi:hypothetical protein